MGYDFDVTIIGAGVVGLAIAKQCAQSGLRVVVLERHGTFGSETSSRNSEVIHAGIYYPPNSLKSILAQRGLNLLYEHCEEYKVSHRRIGKYIVACTDNQVGQLAAIKGNAISAGMEDLIETTQSQLFNAEPNINALEALYSPNTGILNVHEYMESLIFLAEKNDGIISYRTNFLGAEKHNDVFKITYRVEGHSHIISSAILINCAGLSATSVALKVEGIQANSIPTQYFAKGIYYGLPGKSPCSHLIYPIPEPGGLGVHLTLDLAGSCKFGPDVHWIDDVNYTLVEADTAAAHQAISAYLPHVSREDLYPSYAGVRPKITSKDQKDRDFIIQTSQEHGVPNFINLMGIESPGLTSSLAIAEYIMDYCS